MHMGKKREENIPTKQDVIEIKTEKESTAINSPGGITGGYLPRTWEITPQGDFLEIE